ncbi:glycyl-tRNA synthetase beta chain [Desulfocapsa sulfexigens DSM 10523]|uniref:Glycine--tRNA ligase beta subunit n=1 Tax=Desulfocapsa sulfexigens (strain DSM 10523 / SB164P1) TaxID=1167006 RepID=M1PB34_DESSD|nr:glycine--tRNA ligase subunit beta [Desulfocapsa sulfexigens]AGF78857.1 glycyl-tRNA synthetase beta chain [Desulfocapsa sulfexigens DSM 10523]
MPELLFEIGTEELPAGFQKPALDQLKENFIARARELKIAHGSVSTLGTPRRLALLVEDLVDSQPDSRNELMGPSRQAGFDGEGNATRAAIGFASSRGADVSDLKVVETDKGEYLMLVQEIKGVATTELLPDLLNGLMMGFSFPKSMRWGSHSISFARPVQWLVALYDSEIVPFSYQGTAASDTSRGHRFMANEDVKVDDIASYKKNLQNVFVVVDQAERRSLVLTEIEKAVSETLDATVARVAVDEALVDTVCNLVEKPYGVCGSFDEKFLQLPDEALITSMREHQKYFPVVDNENNLLPHFVAVNNTDVKDIALTRAGHERVLRARLEDAFFFFSGDKEKKLEERVDALTGIIFQAELGTMLEKTERIVKLAGLLAEQFAPDSVDDACRAARLCKTDLLTDMVGEFPSLQGNMGCAYALQDGESQAVALAIQEHYFPKRAGAELPTSLLGAVVGLADRIDTISGCFGIGQVPTGTADPFGLRRIALAILHLIEHFELSLSLHDVVHKALSLYGDKVNGGMETVRQVVAFIRGRFVNDQLSLGVDAEAVEAVTTVAFDDVNDSLLKIQALSAIRAKEDFAVLAASYKRICNIIKVNSATDVQEALLTEKAEQNLASIFGKLAEEVQPLLAARDYNGALAAMLILKTPVDEFFNEVMVMAEDDGVRANRLNLLTAISALFLRVGDISKMQAS